MATLYPITGELRMTFLAVSSLSPASGSNLRRHWLSEFSSAIVVHFCVGNLHKVA